MNIIKALPKALAVLVKPQKVNCRTENLQVDITTLCNLKCKMCPRYVLEEPDRNKSITFEDYKKLIDSTLPGSVNLAATGEPFLHPDFFEMVKYAGAKSGAVTITSSNFTYVTPETIDKIISSKLDILKVSIDSPDPETYRAIRGQDYFSKVTDNIKTLNNAKKAAGSVKPSLRLDFVVMIENYRSGLIWNLFMKIPDIRKGLSRLGFDSSTIDK